MRHLFLTAVMVLAGNAAFAASIVALEGTQGRNGSIVTRACAHCPAPATAATKNGEYRVPELDHGTQKIAIVEINGEKKIVRTEAWLGGSPVVHVGKVQAWMTDNPHSVANLTLENGTSTEAAIASVAPSTDGVDLSATTSAVETADVAAEPASPAPIVLADFRLRLN